MSSRNQIPISSLPVDLTFDETVSAVYRDDLDRIEEKLRQGLSVLVECDKQLTLYVYKALRQRFRRASGDRRILCRLISGHAPPPDQEGGMGGMMQTRMQRILGELQEAIFSGSPNQVVVLPHLDVLTTTTRSGLNMETREAAALLYENPDVVFLGFKDPSFELPKVIEEVFTVRHEMIGIARERLPHLILQREARKFGVDTFNPYGLYKYFSGLNAVRCRQILGYFSERMDYDPETPDSVKELYREIREMTLLSDLEVPQVDLDKDIGGYAKIKEEINREILDLLLQKEQTSDAAEIEHIEEIVPKGIIFHGPPGTGKTFFAKAIATALDATLLVVSGPELKSRWVGESEENLRRIFNQARKSAPSIIVFDEIDSFASARGTYTGSGVEHSMVNQLLTEMDGFRKEEMVFIIGTTNFLQSVDPALLRPGRFELDLKIPYPDAEDRLAIIKIYADKFGLKMSEEMMKMLVRKTAGVVNDHSNARYSGDHLYAVMRALKREELRRGKGALEVTEDDLVNAIRGRKKVTLKPEEQRTVAIHEAGHAIAAYVLPNVSTIEEVTIASEDNDMLGYVMREVQENKYITTKSELMDDICVLFGGRIAEQMIIGEISIGAYSDLQRASELARVMVEELGMSDKLGLRTYNSNFQDMFGQRAPRQPVSGQMAQRIDTEIERILKEEEERCVKLLEKHREQLEKMVEILLEKKTIRIKEIKAIFGDDDEEKSEGSDESEK